MTRPVFAKMYAAHIAEVVDDLYEALLMFVNCNAFVPRTGKPTPDDMASDDERRATVYATALAALAKARGEVP